jgi:hypothetical protein
MSNQLQVLGCFSKQPQLQNVVRSMLHLLCKIPASGLQCDWVYSHQDSVNVCILDLDCASSPLHAAEDQSVVVVAISSHPERLTGQAYALKKPLRSQELLKILRNIEDVLLGKPTNVLHDDRDAPIVPVACVEKTETPIVEVTPALGEVTIVEAAPALDDATAAFMKRYVKNVSDNDPVVRRSVAERRATSTDIGKQP